MKYLVLILMFVSTVALADEKISDPTKRGETVKLVDKDGKVTEFNHEDFAIVPRVKRAPKPVKPCPQPQVVERQVEKERVVETYRKNSLALVLGVAPNGYDIDRTPGVAYISTSYGFAAGLLYRRQLSERWGLNVMGLTNYTAMVGPSYSW